MMQGILNRRIPTVLALFLLIAGLGFVLFVTNNTIQFTGQAAPEEEPKNIQISNITDTSFTVSYVTDSEVLGSIQYGTSEEEQPNLQASSSEGTRMHLVTVTNLTPNTTYYFTITSGRNVYTDSGSPFSITTGSTLGALPQERMISGTILRQDGSSGANTFIYVTTENGNIISTKTTMDGTFRLNVSTLQTADLTTYYPFVDDQKMRLSAVGPTHDAKAVFHLSDANPLPPITLSQVYNFTIEDNQEQPAPDSSDITFPVFREEATEEQTVEIINPETNNEGFTDQQPQFEGRGLPNEQVEIVIQSNHEIQTSIVTDDNGNWSYRPETPLEPGEHTLTVKTRDENGILRILTRSFTVYAQGSQFTEPSVSPSAPTPTVSPTVTPSPSPTTTHTPTPSVTDQTPDQSPTPTEEEVLSPSPTATATATPTITPTTQPVEVTVTPQPTVEPTGSQTGTIALFTSFGVILAGGFFYLLARLKIL